MDSEKPRDLKVICAIPSHGDCKAAFTVSLARTVAHFASIPYDGVKDVQVTLIKSSVLPETRAMLVSRCLDMGATHMLFLDDDMKFPPDTIARLLNHNLAVVAVNYPRKNLEARPTAYADEPDYVGPVWSGDRASGLQQVAYCGFGIMLIDMRVFEKLSLPLFSFEPQPPDYIKYMGEDAYFCRKLADAGIPLFIDHDLSKQCSHIGDMEYTNFLSKESEIVRQALYRDLPSGIPPEGPIAPVPSTSDCIEEEAA